MKSKVIVYKGVSPANPKDVKMGNESELVDMNSKECNDLNINLNLNSNSNSKVCKVQKGFRDAFESSFKDRSPIIKLLDDK